MKSIPGADSILGDTSMKLEKLHFPRDLAAIDRVLRGTKRCRICKEVKILAEFPALNQKGKS